MKTWNWCLWVVLVLGVSACGGSATGGIVDEGCGDGDVDEGEECDDGNDVLGDGCEACVSTATCGDALVQGAEECEPGTDENCHPVGHVRECRSVRSAFRMSSFDLLDPKLKINCNDALHDDIVAPALSAAPREDESSGFATPEDGLIDLGFVLTFNPLNMGDGETSDTAFVLSDCDRLSKPSPALNPSPCSPTITQEPLSVTFTTTTQTLGDCITAQDIEGTTQGNPTVNPVEPGSLGCWKSGPIDFAIGLGSIIQVPMSDVTIAAQWYTDETGDYVESGLIRGFLTEADAISNVVAAGTDVIGGKSLKDLFGSDLDGCDTRDVNNGVSGYWVYFGFTAEPVPWEGDLMCGNGVLDTGVVLTGAEEGRDETCDTGIAAGEPGDCAPLLDCDDGIACTVDTVNAGDACAPECFHNPVVIDDCVDQCNDGTLQEWEVCDTLAGTACDDPAELCPDDGDACTVEEIVVSASEDVTKNVCADCPDGACECNVTLINQPDLGEDGCCIARCVTNPSGRRCSTDTNCPPAA